MKIHEYQAKKIISKYGASVPQGFVAKTKMNISFHYQFEGVIRRICEDRGAVILDTRYEAEPCFYLDVEEAMLESFIAELQEITSGRVQVSLDKVV